MLCAGGVDPRVTTRDDVANIINDKRAQTNQTDSKRKWTSWAKQQIAERGLANDNQTRKDLASEWLDLPDTEKLQFLKPSNVDPFS